jgi:hypothetical protein
VVQVGVQQRGARRRHGIVHHLPDVLDVVQTAAAIDVDDQVRAGIGLAVARDEVIRVLVRGGIGAVNGCGMGRGLSLGGLLDGSFALVREAVDLSLGVARKLFRVHPQFEGGGGRHSLGPPKPADEPEGRAMHPGARHSIASALRPRVSSAAPGPEKEQRTGWVALRAPAPSVRSGVRRVIDRDRALPGSALTARLRIIAGDRLECVSRRRASRPSVVLLICENGHKKSRPIK